MSSQRTDSSSAARPFSLAALLIALAVTTIYAVSIDGPLLFDDVPNIVANNFLHIDGGEFDDWRIASESGIASRFGRPLAMLSFALNYVIAGDFVAGHLKAVNLGIHLLTGLLAAALFQRLLRAPAMPALSRDQIAVLSLFAAAIWLLHPLHVSTVLYTVQRMAQLSTLLVVAGLLLFTHRRLVWAERGANAGELVATALWVLMFTLLAFLSKENGLLLPGLLLVVEVTLFRGAWRGGRWRRLYLSCWACLLLPPLGILISLLVAPELIHGLYGGREFTLEERLLTQGRMLWQYVTWILLPNISDMGFFHDGVVVSSGMLAPLTTLASLVAWAAIAVLAFLWRKRFPLLLFCLLFFLVAHSMESTVIPLEMVFEHRNYLPSIALCLLLPVVLFQLVERLQRPRFRVVIASILVTLSVLLLLRVSAWSDEFSLARHNVVNHEHSPRAHFFYGNVLFRQFREAKSGDLDELTERDLAVASRQHFLRAHELDGRELAPLVMLYQIDTVYFPGMPDAPDWLGKLEALVGERRLQSSDRTALGALVNFALSPSGEAERERVMVLFEELQAAYGGNRSVFSLYYKLVRGEGALDKQALLVLLEEQAALHPDRTEIYALLVQEHNLQDKAGTFEAIRAWMEHDDPRRELSVIRGVFEQ